MPTILTYLTATGHTGGHTPRAGDRVHLRPAAGARAAGAAAAEAWSECGHLLGRLPPAERSALAAFDAARLLSARVAAVVPRPGPVRSDRVILQVEAAP